MIKNILNSNEEILPNTKQIEVLKENFPACFNADGSFDIERFKEYLSDKLMVSNEGYELKFLGKNYARLLASIAAIVDKYEMDGNFNPENVVLFGYSFVWTMTEDLKMNLARLKDTEKNLRINFDVRY